MKKIASFSGYGKVLSAVTITFFSFTASAQLNKEQRIQDSVIGWDVKNYYDRNYKPQTTPVGKQREAIANKMAEWLKASYTPVGSLGEYQRFVGTVGFGLHFQPWNVGYDYLDAQKKFRPIPEENTPAHFTANQFYGAWEIDFMNKKGECFMTFQPDGYSSNSTIEGRRKGMDPRVHPNVYKMKTWVNEWVTIYITPNNQLPILPVSKGELLDKAAASLDVVLEDIKKEETQRWQGNPKGLESAMAVKNEELEKTRKEIQALKEKYKNSLNEQAMVVDYQTNWRSFHSGSWDIFKSGPNTIYYPVYKLDAATLTKMKGPTPLFLSMAVPFATKGEGTRDYELYTAITQNINYDYIYNYFFDPEKVKGVPYTPANAADMKARLDGYRNKNNYNLNTKVSGTNWPANVHYMEDFSKNAEGNDPADWFYNRAGTTPFSVVTIPGESGKWLKLGVGRPIRPSLLKSPWPKNFNVEFDVVTDNGYTGRTGGAVELMLSTRELSGNNTEVRSTAAKDAVITVRVESGSDADYKAGYNYRGLLRVSVNNTPDPNEENFSKGIRAEYKLGEFTDKKTKVHIGVQLKDGFLTILVNGKPVISQADFKMTYGGACKLCGVPAELLFRSMTFNNVTNDNKTVEVYIGNVKITKG
ncbi:MAG: hypothetical protein DI535_15620 [Citrobacter freundii]|nr:MAG: hypothetical protein DI535_15620 [Citrobacter freundii]